MHTVATPFTSSASLELSRELRGFERLAISLSSSFSALGPDEATERVAGALAAIGAAFGAEECTLVAYRARDEAHVVGSWAAGSRQPCSDDDLAELPWMLQRVARNTVVSVTAESDYPEAAAADRASAARTGMVARLAVPIVLGTRVSFALILGAAGHPGWNDAAAERLRHVGEIVGTGIERIVHHDELPGAPATAAAHDVRHTSHETVRHAAHDAAHTAAHDAALPASGIVGNSPAIALAMERLNQVAPLDVTVLLLGETGTGKELFARAVHERSRRRQGPFIRVNCAALPPTLIESELFGHERGAFTGATALRQGRFELADGGTIFLDEIGDLAPELQAKILRALQEGEFERVGSSKVRHVHVRVVAATHVPLEQAVEEGRFRADLFYRLNVFPITLPPLRDRRGDIPELVWTIIKRRQRDLGRQITTVSVPVMEALTRYDWPGNVRELENVIDRALISTRGDTLQLDRALGSGTAAAAAAVPTDGTLDAVQRQYIEKVLRECGGRINGEGNAAVRLGLHPNTLRFRIKKLGVVVPGRERESPADPGAQH
jgi:transcriptional regulator with GAF, ATPase, and Fis domain